jgi:hypothetical protein
MLDELTLTEADWEEVDKVEECTVEEFDKVECTVKAHPCVACCSKVEGLEYKVRGLILELQELDKLRKHVFGHGQLYVALSRCTDRRNLIKDSAIEGMDGAYTRNVVYHSILRDGDQSQQREPNQVA